MATITFTTENFGTAVGKLYKQVRRSGKIVVSVKEEMASTKEVPNADLARYLRSEEFKNDKSEPMEAEEFLKLLKTW